jgi:hypothetical protein
MRLKRVKALRLGTFLCLRLATTRKLGISFFKYMQDRIFKKSEIPSLGTIIRDRYFQKHQPLTWQEELFCMSG